VGNTGPLAKTAALRILDLLLDGALPAATGVGSSEAGAA
jgi:hypothetical protein